MRKRAFVAIPAALALAVLSVTACSVGGGPSNPADDTVKYEITGTVASPVDVYYVDAASDTNSAAGVTLPWSHQYAAASGQWLYFRVSSFTQGTISLKLYESGNVVYSYDAAGPGVVWVDFGNLP